MIRAAPVNVAPVLACPADPCLAPHPPRTAAPPVIAPPGAPAPGLAFLDWCISNGSLMSGAASFPRMGCYAGGLATCAVPGEARCRRRLTS